MGNESLQLKPCPFCGGTDVNLRQHLATNMSWVSCGECGLEAPSETGWTDDIAIEYWNTRNDDAKDLEIAALREAMCLGESVEAEIDRVVQSVNEWDDRTSPDDYPDHLLITSEELAEILTNFAVSLKEQSNA